MILCDPFAINTLSLSTIRHLQELVSQETLPRVSIVMAAGCVKLILPAWETEFYSIGGYWHMGAVCHRLLGSWLWRADSLLCPVRPEDGLVPVSSC